MIETGKNRARELLRAKQSFIWNATNLSRLVRDPLIDLFASYGARIRIVVCHTPFERLQQQNAQRERTAHVPRSVIAAMLGRFDPPSIADCHDLIIYDNGLAIA